MTFLTSIPQLDKSDLPKKTKISNSRELKNPNRSTIWV
ncbi:MAG: hypothetical protein K0S24_1526 [Sphingobacterium sp.]|jgi:hypothetical protein|nr:hypothetical protein [Sphingobacterium sp.]